HPQINRDGIFANLSTKVRPLQLIPMARILNSAYVPSHSVSLPRSLTFVEVRGQIGPNSKQWTVFSGLSLQQIANREHENLRPMFHWNIEYEEAALNHLLDFLYANPRITLIAAHKQYPEQFLTFLSLVPKETRIFLHKQDPLYTDETLGSLEGFFTYGESK